MALIIQVFLPIQKIQTFLPVARQGPASKQSLGGLAEEEREWEGRGGYAKLGARAMPGFFGGCCHGTGMLPSGLPSAPHPG